MRFQLIADLEFRYVVVSLWIESAGIFLESPFLVFFFWSFLVEKKSDNC